MERRTIPVDGLACDGCERTVESAVETLDGVTRVAADHGTGTVEVVAAEGLADADLRAAIEGAGYDVSG